jgi:hypothetical protein
MKTPMQQAIDKLIDLAYQMGTDDEVLDSFSAGTRRGYLESASELHKFLEMEQNQLIEQWKKGWDEAISEAIKELCKYQ